MTKQDIIQETHDAVIKLVSQGEYTNNHLQNIDSHLNHLNERTNKNETDIAINKEEIANKDKWAKDMIYKLGIPTSGFVVLAVIAFILKLVGVY